MDFKDYNANQTENQKKKTRPINFFN